jgi:hypothetical protein
MINSMSILIVSAMSNQRLKQVSSKRILILKILWKRRKDLLEMRLD